MSQTLPSLMDESKVRDVSSMTASPAFTCDIDMHVIRNGSNVRIGNILAVSVSVSICLSDCCGEMLHDVVDQGACCLASSLRNRRSLVVSCLRKVYSTVLYSSHSTVACAKMRDFPTLAIPVSANRGDNRGAFSSYRCASRWIEPL